MGLTITRTGKSYFDSTVNKVHTGSRMAISYNLDITATYTPEMLWINIFRRNKEGTIAAGSPPAPDANGYYTCLEGYNYGDMVNGAR